MTQDAPGKPNPWFDVARSLRSRGYYLSDEDQIGRLQIPCRKSAKKIFDDFLRTVKDVDFGCIGKPFYINVLDEHCVDGEEFDQIVKYITADEVIDGLSEYYGREPKLSCLAIFVSGLDHQHNHTLPRFEDIYSSPWKGDPKMASRQS